MRFGEILISHGEFGSSQKIPGFELDVKLLPGASLIGLVVQVVKEWRIG